MQLVTNDWLLRPWIALNRKTYDVELEQVAVSVQMEDELNPGVGKTRAINHEDEMPVISGQSNQAA
jgi:hypothetical protein